MHHKHFLKKNLWKKCMKPGEKNILVNSLTDLRFPFCYLEFNEEIKNA